MTALVICSMKIPFFQYVSVIRILVFYEIDLLLPGLPAAIDKPPFNDRYEALDHTSAR
jgi:hypothetical protein